MTNPFCFANSYAQLPERFYSRLSPSRASEPATIRVNLALAQHLNIDAGWLNGEEATQTLAGNLLPPGADPLAMVYAGHQFGSWNPQLGDGRALLLGEVEGRDGILYDIQLKGSGPTPYSRGGDGRSPLGPVLREYLISEAMAALGVPTTRSLAAVSTGDRVIRESALPGAVLTRVAKGHTRIGTFQFFFSREDHDALQQLANYVIKRHYPQALDQSNSTLALFESVIESQAKLVAQWQWLGFIHGVMNTDNVLISGETVDYGPCAFMDHFEPGTVFSSIDQGGRYAYGNQPGIAHWNLACLAQCLLPLLDEIEDKAVEIAQAAVNSFPSCFESHYLRIGRQKLGLKEDHADDKQLIEDLLAVMQQQKADFTLTFRRLSDLANSVVLADNTVAALFELGADFKGWLQRWQQRCKLEKQDSKNRQDAMYQNNPALIPRNHLVQEAIDQAVIDNDFSAFHTLTETLQNPFVYHSELAAYATPPQPGQEVYQTFCGT